MRAAFAASSAFPDTVRAARSIATPLMKVRVSLTSVTALEALTRLVNAGATNAGAADDGAEFGLISPRSIRLESSAFSRRAAQVVGVPVLAAVLAAVLALVPVPVLCSVPFPWAHELSSVRWVSVLMATTVSCPELVRRGAFCSR